MTGRQLTAASSGQYPHYFYLSSFFPPLLSFAIGVSPVIPLPALSFRVTNLLIKSHPENQTPISIHHYSPCF